jgi:transposase
VIADSAGLAVAFALAPGQAHELPQAVPLLARLPDVPMWVVADRGYSSHAFREHVWGLGARPAIPTRRDEAPVACPDPIYNNRNRVERLWARLKEWRAVATRYEKTAASFMGVLCLAATMDRVKRRRISPPRPQTAAEVGDGVEQRHDPGDRHRGMHGFVVEPLAPLRVQRREARAEVHDAVQERVDGHRRFLDRPHRDGPTNHQGERDKDNEAAMVFVQSAEPTHASPPASGGAMPPHREAATKR